jgi:hypothetical protein
MRRIGLWALGIGMLASVAPIAVGQGYAGDCTNATLKGDYAFSVVDFTTPLVVVGIGTFDGKVGTSGKGGFSQVDYRGDSLALDPSATDFAGGETGWYKVNPDCTGSQVIHLNVPVPSGSHGVIENRFVISDGGRAIHGVVAKSIPPGSTLPLHTQTRVDFWKVRSDEDN